MHSEIPIPEKDESPTRYADRIGQWYGEQITAQHRKKFGMYLTPPEVANFMAGLCNKNSQQLHVLDPAAGAGVLGCAVAERFILQSKTHVTVEIDAYELDKEFILPLRSSLRYLQKWAKSHGAEVKSNVYEEDFILECAGALEAFQFSLPITWEGKSYDVVIANPPYFKLPKSDPRVVAASSVVHGQPNIYSLFMAVAAATLREKGDFIFITPRSFASGPYFRLFREKFFSLVLPKQVHVFDSRTATFKRDQVLQENVILRGQRITSWQRVLKDPLVTLSSSHGKADLKKICKRKKPISHVIDFKTRSKLLRLPSCEEDDTILDLVDRWSGSLHKYGMEISTGPVVPFRATELLEKSGNVPKTHAPLLWMQHVTSMEVSWPREARKPEYILIRAADRKLLVDICNYVVLRRFSAKEEKRRLTAAPYFAKNFEGELLGLENHLNYIHRPGGKLSEDEIVGIAGLYNSVLFDTYFRAINGNTQVSATELREAPLPDLELIKSLGKRLKKKNDPMAVIDSLVAELLSVPDFTELAIAV